MYVRPLKECSFRYMRNSMRAYLEGKKNLRWVVGVIGAGTLDVGRALQAFNDIRTPTDPRRRVELMAWFQERLNTNCA